ncbi:MAG: RNA methyltransferase [Clostridiales bacterium]|nr:RNA methyltransferase [Clostridiales bacterium]
MVYIESKKNAKLKRLRLLASDPKLRYSEGVYICEGMKLLQEAVRSGVTVESVLWEKKACDAYIQEFENLLTCEHLVTDREIYHSVSTLKNHEGVIFVCHMASQKRSEKSRAIALENVQDPGNVGTVIRSADAFGVDTVYLIGECCDIYNPKTVRATMGSLFRINVIRTTFEDFLAEVRSRGEKVYCAALNSVARDIREVDLDDCVVIIGNEGKGITPEAEENCDGAVIIPMSGKAESLNAAVASSIVMWEMNRRKCSQWLSGTGFGSAQER